MMLSKLVGLINAILILCQSINIQGRKPFLGDFMQKKTPNKQANKKQQIYIDTTKLL